MFTISLFRVLSVWMEEIELSKHISKEAQDLLKKIIKVNPEQRIKIADLKKHPWFKLANINYNMHRGLNPKEIVYPIIIK